MALLAALECVSLVTWFDEDTPIARIHDCHPDVLVKGGDWPVEKIVGYAEVTGLGRQRALHPLHPPALDHGPCWTRSAGSEKVGAGDTVPRIFSGLGLAQDGFAHQVDVRAQGVQHVGKGQRRAYPAGIAFDAFQALQPFFAGMPSMDLR
jgi:hypothetical protein